MWGISFFVFLFSFWILSAELIQKKCKDIGKSLAAVESKVLVEDAFHPSRARNHVLQNYKSLSVNDEFHALFPPEKVLLLFTKVEKPHQFENFRLILEEYQKEKAQGPNTTSYEVLRRVLSQYLIDRVPSNSIAQRVQDAFEGKRGAFERVLGDMTLVETLELIHGGDPLQPTADSLIGKYLAETGATTLVRAFTREPNQPESANVGPKRLVVSVSEQSFQQYLKYFMRAELFSVHAHALVGHNKKLYSYQNPGNDFRLPSAGYPLPQVVLKPSEAERFHVFMELLSSELLAGKSYSVNNRAMHPWTIPNFLAQGGYVNCTHWIGNIPIGDKKSDKLVIPSQQNFPLEVPYQTYRSPEKLLTRVWRKKSHEQLSHVIGVGDHNSIGNMASPGYLIHTLLGEVPVDRVPFVLYVVQDHTQPIAENFPYTVENAN